MAIISSESLCQNSAGRQLPQKYFPHFILVEMTDLEVKRVSTLSTRLGRIYTDFFYEHCSLHAQRI